MTEPKALDRVRANSVFEREHAKNLVAVTRSFSGHPPMDGWNYKSGAE